MNVIITVSARQYILNHKHYNPPLQISFGDNWNLFFTLFVLFMYLDSAAVFCSELQQSGFKINQCCINVKVQPAKFTRCFLLFALRDHVLRCSQIAHKE